MYYIMLNNKLSFYRLISANYDNKINFRRLIKSCRSFKPLFICMKFLNYNLKLYIEKTDLLISLCEINYLFSFFLTFFIPSLHFDENSYIFHVLLLHLNTILINLGYSIYYLVITIHAFII